MSVDNTYMKNPKPIVGPAHNITETTTFHCLQINTEYFQLSLQEYIYQI